MKERIIEMLGRGIPATQVAAAVGCDDSYVSQLLGEEGVEARVAALRAEHFAKYAAQDDEVDKLEQEALAQVKKLIPFITKPAEAVRVYGVLNAAKRRTADAVSNSQAVAQTVALDLPAATRVRFTVTPDRQVIEIEGRSMATMPAKSLAATLEQRRAERHLTADIPATLPFVLEEPATIPVVERL